jgi:hypothetical protein
MVSHENFVKGTWLFLAAVLATTLLFLAFSGDISASNTANPGAFEKVACIKRDTGTSPKAVCAPETGIIRFNVQFEAAQTGDLVKWSMKCQSRAKAFTGTFVAKPSQYANLITIDSESGNTRVLNTMENDTCTVKAWVSAKEKVWLTLTVKVRTA